MLPGDVLRRMWRSGLAVPDDGHLEHGEGKPASPARRASIVARPYSKGAPSSGEVPNRKRGLARSAMPSPAAGQGAGDDALLVSSSTSRMRASRIPTPCG